ncbi:hypothetical protein CTheo_6928 [Ceratobasidium theobromae]|uniref:Uncharacterized protein n=1 Tax=Ceratobasidium theobromae TaxID=1582974 RepID=A0A5N5QDM1_9AGAM|nr:hypothetical protein CTheo_6928 [Ceratobasidium theobromae]
MGCIPTKPSPQSESGPEMQPISSTQQSIVTTLNSKSRRSSVDQSIIIDSNLPASIQPAAALGSIAELHTHTMPSELAPLPPRPTCIAPRSPRSDSSPKAHDQGGNATLAGSATIGGAAHAEAAVAGAAGDGDGGASGGDGGGE